MGFNAPDQAALEQARDQAIASHRDFWSNNGHQSEDENGFFPGFETGWHAAIEKLQNGEDLPGDLEGWAREHGSHHWEFEHGFRQGAEAAKAAGHFDEEQQEEHHEERHHDEE